MGKNIVGLIGVVASLVGVVASFATNWADGKKTEMLIDEKIEKALAERNGEEEDETKEENE